MDDNKIGQSGNTPRQRPQQAQQPHGIWTGSDELPPRPLRVIELLPWWRRGHAWLAALAWLAFYALVFLLLFEVIEPSYMSAGTVILFLTIALGASFHGGKNERTNHSRDV